MPRRRQVDISLPLRAPRPGVNVPNHVNSPGEPNTPGVANGTLGWISTKLAGDHPQTKAHLPRRRPVDAWLPRRAALAGVKCAKSRLGAAGRRRGLVRGGDCCSPACLNPLGTLTKKSVMMDRSLTIITHLGLSVESPALANPGGGCRQAPSPTSPRKIKLEAGVRPLGEVMGTCCPPRNRRPRVPAARGAGDTASPGSSSETWGRLPRGPRGKDPSKKKSAPIFAKIFLQVGRGVGRCAAKTAGGSEHHPPSTAARSKCAKSRQLPLGTDTPGIATRTLGSKSTRLAGDLPHIQAHLP